MVVVKIGGCNGSGKTSTVRALLGQFKFEALLDTKGRTNTYYTKPVADLADHKLIVLGRYEAVCGGMDSIVDKEERLALIKQHAVDRNIVIFEGLIASKAYGATGELALSQRGRWLYMFMDTPFEVCVERVYQRRRAALIEKYGSEGELMPDEFDPERTMRETYKVYENRQLAARKDGHRVIMLDHTKTPNQLARDIIKHVKKIL